MPQSSSPFARASELEGELSRLRADRDHTRTLARVRGSIIDAQSATIATFREQLELERQRTDEWRAHAHHLSRQLERLRTTDAP